MTPDDRKQLVRQAVDDAWNRGDFARYDELYAENCSFHLPAFPAEGAEGSKQQIRELRHAQPDLHADIHEVLCDGDLTAARWTMGGTATHEFQGLPATGKSYVMSGMSIGKWENDKIVEEWTDYNLLGALQQLGIVPEMTQTPTA